MAIFYNTDRLPDFKNAVVTIGTFDGVHLGHKVILNEAVKYANKTGGESILLTFEPHPRKLLFPDKSIQIITPLEQKLELITAAGIQHVIVVPFNKAFSELTAEAYIKDFLVSQVKAKTIIIGYDHRFGNDRQGDINLLKQYATYYHYNIQEIPAQLIDDAAVSSTKIRKALSEGNITDANTMLGREYSFIGNVVHGTQLGRTIGYPTANMKPIADEQLIPAEGVYAIKAKWNKQELKGMLNIGYRPTVTNEMRLKIEANLFDFNENIYNQTLEIIFIERLRNEEKFPSIDALKEQLAKDKENAMQILNSL
ncbi:MAG: bifunctional riboflavin kinase/FAD synthetase [Bacteroidetes bacterium]|nr:bifunctional riboflavin kinase/FAD synthetase [Bacteroidota bacterium]